MRWRYGVLVGIFLALLSLYPQAALIYERKAEYNGATFVNDNDESVYIAYLQAMIDGRPRKNNIYSGKKEEAPETFLSIQALPAYVVAIPAKFVGISAERSSIFLSVISAFAAAICLFWFVSKATGNVGFAAAATLFVLVMGTSVAGYGALKYFLGINPASASLPFLRRYTPGVVFPFIFLLGLSVWSAYQAGGTRKKVIYAVCASVCFGVLLYSYFYLWTAALVWIATLALLTVILKEDDQRSLIKKFWLPVFAFCIAIDVPYLILLLQRSESTDGAQGLEITHQFVISRPSIWLGTMIVLATVLLARYGRIVLNQPITLFIISFALLPIIVFNQQVITGYSLQPFHYNLYIAPYAALLSLVLLASELLSEKLSKLKPPIWLFLVVLLGVWGIVESHYVMRYRLAGNIARDKALPVSQRLAEIGYRDFDDTTSQVTFNADAFQADNQPAIAPQGVLWSEHLPWASSLSDSEVRRRYYLYLYYIGKDADFLREDLKQCPGGASCKALFGWRAIPTLSIGQNSPKPEEIEAATGEFESFLQDFGGKDASDPVISYAVVPESTAFDFTRIDKWYSRDGGEDHGGYKLYKLQPRTANSSLGALP